MIFFFIVSKKLVKYQETPSNWNFLVMLKLFLKKLKIPGASISHSENPFRYFYVSNNPKLNPIKVKIIKLYRKPNQKPH